MLKTNNEVRAYPMRYSPLFPIHLRNRDASSVMLAGSQAWHWGFLTHHALFIVQSNRVCKMRITQHEENRREGTEGKSGGERRKEKGAKVREHVEEKEIKEKKRERDSGHCQTSISYPCQVNPWIVFRSLWTVGWRKWIWNQQPR